MNNKFSPEQVHNYLNQLSPKVSRNTLSRKQSSLNRFLAWAKEAGYLEEDTVFDQKNTNPTPLISEVKAFKFESAWLKLAGAGIAVWALCMIWIVTVRHTNQTQVQIPVPQNNQPTAITNGRFIPFTGKLMDQAGYQIGEPVQIAFALFDAPDNGNLLWSSQECLVGPEDDGSFSITLGATNGTNFECARAQEIPGQLFYESTGLWLSMAINSDLPINPRIPISTVANAQNTETLSGYQASEIPTENTIPVIDQNGDLVIASTLPKLRSTSLGGSFLIEGQGGLVLSSSDSSNSPITLNPDGAGNVNFLFEGASPLTNGFVNVTNANIANGALYYGEAGNDLSGYALIDLRAGSNLAPKFTVDSTGNTFLAGQLTVQTLESRSGVPLVVDESGRIYKQSSSTKYKTNISDFVDDYKKILRLSPQKYHYLGQNEEEIGYLAESLNQIGLKELVVYNTSGTPEGIKYDKIPLYLIPIIKEQEEKLGRLFKLLSPLVDENTIAIDGKLTANEVVANEVVANKIVANQITADLITDSQGNRVVSESVLFDQEAKIDEIENYLKNSVTSDIESLKTLAEALALESTQKETNLENLFVTGKSVMISLSLSDNLTIGTDFSISNNNLNTLQGPLEIQPLAQAPVHFMGGLVAINQQGTITAPEIAAKKITTETLTIKDDQKMTGHATLLANETEVVITNLQVKANSLLQLTPTTSTFNNVLYVKSKTDGLFSVGILQPAPENIEFDWLMVQKENTIQPQ